MDDLVSTPGQSMGHLARDNSSVLASLLPHFVVTVADPAATGRECARRALEALGADQVPIGKGPRGEPLWPAGIAGSITHCPGYTAAAVAWAEDVKGLGIDAEVLTPLAPAVVEVVCTPAERRMLRALADEQWPLVVFSAKESVFKAWYPLTGQWLEYGDVQVSLDSSAGTFSASIKDTDTVSGRFGLDGGLVFTAVALLP